MSQRINSRGVNALTLERVFGCSITGKYDISVNTLTGETAYRSGCICVIYDRVRKHQTRLQCNKPVECVRYSPSGRYLLVSTARKVSIFDIQSDYKKHEIVHRDTVCGACFSPDDKYIACIGNENERWMKIWDVSTGRKLSFKKFRKVIHGIEFSRDSSMVVICGQSYVKYYRILDVSTNPQIPRITLTGKPCSLSRLQNRCFVDIAASKVDNMMYAMTADATLCIFVIGAGVSKNDRAQKWIEDTLGKNKKCRGRCVRVSHNYILCAGSNGVVRFFRTGSLMYINTLPSLRAHTNLTNASISRFPKEKRVLRFPVVACDVDSGRNSIVVVYGDRSIVFWDITDPANENGFRIFERLFSHNKKVTGLDIISCEKSPLPMHTIATCSEDKTIRFWNMGTSKSSSKRERFVHSIELEVNESSASDTVGFSAMGLSSDGCYLASGDKRGNLRIHDLHEFRTLSSELAHRGEIMSLHFGKTSKEKLSLLATSGEDNEVQLFQFSEDRGCESFETIKVHESPVSNVRFSVDGKRMLSVDKNGILFISKINEDLELQEFDIISTDSKFGKITNFNFEPTNKYVITCAQNQDMKIWDISQGMVKRQYRNDGIGLPFLVCTDPSGIHAITSCNDGNVRVYDFYSGDCYATIRGHSGIITGVKVSEDCRRLVTVGNDGLVLVWKFNSKLIKTMRARRKEMRKMGERRASAKSMEIKQQEPVKIVMGKEEVKSEVDSALFQKGKLPSWANGGRDGKKEEDMEVDEQPRPKRSVWAQRKEKDDLNIIAMNRTYNVINSFEGAPKPKTKTKPKQDNADVMEKKGSLFLKSVGSDEGEDEESIRIDEDYVGEIGKKSSKEEFEKIGERMNTVSIPPLKLSSDGSGRIEIEQSIENLRKNVSLKEDEKVDISQLHENVLSKLDEKLAAGTIDIPVDVDENLRGIVSIKEESEQKSISEIQNKTEDELERIPRMEMGANDDQELGAMLFDMDLAIVDAKPDEEPNVVVEEAIQKIVVSKSQDIGEEEQPKLEEEDTKSKSVRDEERKDLSPTKIVAEVTIMSPVKEDEDDEPRTIPGFLEEDPKKNDKSSSSEFLFPEVDDDDESANVVTKEVEPIMQIPKFEPKKEEPKKEVVKEEEDTNPDVGNIMDSIKNIRSKIAKHKEEIEARRVEGVVDIRSVSFFSDLSVKFLEISSEMEQLLRREKQPNKTVDPDDDEESYLFKEAIEKYSERLLEVFEKNVQNAIEKKK